MKKIKDSILPFLGVVLLFTLIFALVKLLIHLRIADGLQAIISAHESWGWAIYIILNAILFCLSIPTAVLGSMAGAIFGLTWGSILFIFSSVLACLFAFYLTRIFLYTKIQKKVETSPKLDGLQAAVENEGLLLLCLIRFLPIHTTFLNLLLAVTRINLKQFLFSCACMIPEWLAYIYLGFMAAESERHGLTTQPSPVHDILKIATFVLVVIAISYAGRVAQKSFQAVKNNNGA